MTTNAIAAAREAVMDALGGYGEAMFLKGNPHNRPDPRLDMKAVWQAIDAYRDALLDQGRAEGAIAELENMQTLPCPKCNCGTIERRLADARKRAAPSEVQSPP